MSAIATAIHHPDDVFQKQDSLHRINIKFINEMSAVGRAKDLTNPGSKDFISEEDLIVRLPSGIVVTVTSAIHQSRHSTIFRGNALIGEESIDVAVKLAPQEDLKREATVYANHFGPLEGDVVPVFYGVFYTEETSTHERACCMITQHFGSALNAPFHSLSLVDKAKILNSLWQVHQCGISLRDFTEHNVLTRDGHYMLVGFHLNEQHTCQWTFDFLHDAELDGSGKRQPTNADDDSGDSDDQDDDDDDDEDDNDDDDDDKEVERKGEEENRGLTVDWFEESCYILSTTALNMDYWYHGDVLIYGMQVHDYTLPTQGVIDDLRPPQIIFKEVKDSRKLYQVLFAFYRLVQCLITEGRSVDSLRPEVHQLYLQAKEKYYPTKSQPMAFDSYASV